VRYRADAALIASMRRAGLTYREISAQAGVSLQAIGAALMPLGLGRQPVRCGTPAGAAKHRRNGEQPCEPCRVARNEDWKQKQAASTELCSVEGCAKPVFGKGWCSKHWGAWRRHGDPLANREPVPRSGYRGVRKQARGTTWSARIKVNGRQVHLGNFPAAEDAARAYDAYLLANGLHLRTGKGRPPRLNFPHDPPGSAARTAAGKIEA
jgi:hypothetical protein